MPEFQLPQLPYAADALAPAMSAETLAFHHGRHHAAYVANLNALVKDSPWEGRTLEEIIRGADGALFNNAAQHFNHSFFWRCLSPEGGGRPEGGLLRAIEDTWGTYEAFVEAFSKAAAGNFGSGWTWLVRRPDGTLAIENTSNADTPVKRAAVPILVLDVWEHAYYVDYRNARPAFIRAFFEHLVDWRAAGARFV